MMEWIFIPREPFYSCTHLWAHTECLTIRKILIFIRQQAVLVAMVFVNIIFTTRLTEPPFYKTYVELQSYCCCFFFVVVGQMCDSYSINKACLDDVDSPFQGLTIWGELWHCSSLNSLSGFLYRWRLWILYSFLPDWKSQLLRIHLRGN